MPRQVDRVLVSGREGTDLDPVIHRRRGLDADAVRPHLLRHDVERHLVPAVGHAAGGGALRPHLPQRDGLEEIRQSKDHDPDGWDWNPFDGTYIRVDGGSTNTSEPGDSGSPFFVEDLAYGIATHELKEDDNDTLYMAINYASDLGVSVLTSNPGICNLVPTASFTAGARFDGTANFNGSTSSDPDGTVVRWEWDFGDGTTGVSTTPYITRVYPPDSGSYYVTLTVTDNEGKRASASKEVCVPTISCTDRPVQ